MEQQLVELQRKFEEAKARADEEQRRREAAEAESQPKNLIEYLETCHSFSLALEVVTDKSLSTQGDTTVPTGRPFPQRIRVFPSAHQLDYVQKYLDPIALEFALRHYARETVENPVRTLIQEIHKHEQFREQLQLWGTIMFESHTNLGQPIEPSMEKEMEHMSISEPNISRVGGSRAKGKGKQVSRQHNTRVRRTNGPSCFSIEYKAPHKFPLAQIIAGLNGEIRPGEEIINQEGDDFEFLSKSLVATVVTQLFSYMIAKGVQHGYVFDGEAIIFLYILNDDPSTVCYHLSILRLDFQEDDENRLHRTSVAQILAFVLGALAAESPRQSWHDAAAGLETWAVEYIDILKKIPETERKASRSSPYNASRWKEFNRSPIKTRSRLLAATCNKPVNDQTREKSDEDDDTPPTPTPNRTTRPRIGQGEGKPKKRYRASRSQNRSNSTGQEEVEEVSTTRIEDRPYCTQKCLLGRATSSAASVSSSHEAAVTKLTANRSTSKELEEHSLKFDSLHTESKVYNRLRSLQGNCIPVCLGISNLKLPYYYDCGVYVTMLFLSWAGRPLHQYINLENENDVIKRVTSALKALHNLQVLHKDAKPRNMLWDEHRGRLMLVDFERAEIQTRLPLGIIIANRKRNRQGDIKMAVKENDFDREMSTAISCIRM
ncbi:hypothetical protein VE00_10595 [Pseudogymnoascus sp. WSF 3629]|nr:hypothetical protein VE00_10595 [Pseudogymnoascus sp. WSF 3629]